MRLPTQLFVILNDLYEHNLIYQEVYPIDFSGIYFSVSIVRIIALVKCSLSNKPKDKGN